MRVLGLHDGQTSGAAVVVDGELAAAVNEERLVRMKQARGFPRRSIAEALRLAGVSPEEVDAVAVAQRDMSFHEDVRPWRGWFEERRTADDLHGRFFRTASRFAGAAEAIPVLKRLYYAFRRPVYARRRRRVRSILREELGIDAEVAFVDHHFAHAAAAYRGSGFRDALVVTMDGGGDGSSSHVYSVRDGEWERRVTVDSYDSLGNYYAYVTALCGFKAKKHEGKITGLAAHGRPVHRDLLRELIAYDEVEGRTWNRGRVLFDGALERLRESLPEGWRREDLAASVQAVAEELAGRHVATWLDRTGHDRVAVAGGVFANVRINQVVHELPRVEEVFVFPGMGDDGLAAGAAWARAGRRARVARRERYAPGPASRRLPDVHLGPSYSVEEMEDALRGSGLEFERMPRPAEGIAEALARGEVVARFSGRMEFGPRALGHRSILYQPTDPTAQDWLNDCLDRTEFMPFAPAVLLEEAERCFEGTDGALDAARFMTITFDCTPWMRERCPGVVHVDGTARPQLVDREESPGFWEIIDAYRRRTGLPMIVNTSFNMHEEPIVCSPEDAVRAFETSRLDYLAMGPFLVRGREGTASLRGRSAAVGEGGGEAAAPARSRHSPAAERRTG